MVNILLSFLFLLVGNLSSAQSYKIGHCYNGCPQGTSEENHLIIRSIYALSYNTLTKSADWVSYKVSADSIGIASSLSRAAVRDGYVKATLTEEDFAKSEDIGLVRSQYASLVDFAGTPFWNEVNYLTNNIARTSSLSQGAWYGLDWSIRNLVNRQGEVYVLTGPIFDSNEEAMLLPITTPHRVPDRFFKVVVNKVGQSAAFILEQSAAVHVHHCEMIASIEEIENLTALNLFPLQTPILEESVYSALGCY